METLHKLFYGKERAYRVFWYWGGGVLFVVSLLSLGADLFVPQISGVMLFFYDACCAFWSYAMWRCAFNETHHVWGIVYRCMAVFMLLSVLIDVPGVWEDESSTSGEYSTFLNVLSGGKADEYIALCQKELAHKAQGSQPGIPGSLYLSECLMRRAKELQSQ